MNPAKKIAQILALIFLAFYITSCDTGCVEADEFDVESVVIESNPIKDGVFGSYDAVSGGQRANWHNTDLLSNGDRFLIQISGAWTPLQGVNEAALNALPRCNSCAKRYDNSSPNCICYPKQNPTPEKGIDGIVLSVDCSLPANQEDPTKCSCTKQHGNATDYGVYHFPLNILDKNESLKVSDEQTNCKYDRGMGAYIALWGSRGASVPMRAYHLYSEEEICNIIRNSNGKCLDAGGNDVTRYVFRSANNTIFMKDDGAGNEGVDTNSADDVYHKPNEEVKTIMWDTYYSDNYGKYNIRILRGVGNESDTGLLEFIVSLVEDVLLGEMDDYGERHGGIIEFMYKAIVQDSGFIWVVQVSLALYIALFGAAHLFGVAEISSKKELMNRVLKISLIVFFISPQSWYFYNKIIVSFFKDGMDYMVAMVMDLYDAQIDQTSMIKIAQMDRARDASNATRFSYVDLVIKNLMSAAVTKKIFGLFFDSIFGFIYIPIIYTLIFSFIYVMLYVASMYIVNLIKIIFVLSLGPIFMVFTLFSHTAGMFKNWLSFLGARSLEVITIFLVLYMFLTILDKNFVDLLFYRVCGVNKGLGHLSFTILVVDLDRSFLTWMSKFISIGGLLFISYLIIQKVPSVAGSIISISGSKGGGSSFGMAGKMMGAGFGLAKQGAGMLGQAAATAGGLGIRGATLAARKTGLAGLVNKAADKIPMRISPRTLWRDAVIDGAIKKATAAAAGKTGKARDEAIRQNAMKELDLLQYKNPNKFRALGIDRVNISERFDKKLVKEPLKQFIKDETKRRKALAPSKVQFGKEAQKAVQDAALKWSKENLYEGADKVVADYFKNSKGINDLNRQKTELSSSRAAKMLAGDKDAQNRYMAYLQDKQFEQRNDWKISKFMHGMMRDKYKNPKQMQSSFMNKVDRLENPEKWYEENPLKNINVLNKGYFNRDEISKRTADTNKDVMAKTLLAGNLSAEKTEFLRDKLAKFARQEIPEERQLIHKYDKRREMETMTSGADLYNRAAQIAEINCRFNGGRDFRDELKTEIERFMKEQNELAKKAAADRALEMRQGMAELAKISGIGSTKELDDLLLSEMKSNNASITKQVGAFDKVDENNIDQAKAASGLVAQQFEVQFGQSITDALLQQSDLGLKAGNVLLGVSAPQEGKIDEAVLNGLRMNKVQLDAKAKIEKMNLKIKQFELKKLQDKTDRTPAEETELKNMQKEIRDMENDVKGYENEIMRVENEILLGGGSL